MGEKKNEGEGKKDGGSNGDEKKKDAAGSGGEKKEGKAIVVVLKMDMHCEGCASKILKYVKSIDGVEKAKVDWESNKLTVLGDVDPVKIREDLQGRTKKKVEIVSPQPPGKDKKEKADEDGGGKKGAGDDGKKSDNKKGEEEPKKPKEAPVAITAVFKVELHCSGCVQKIQRIVSKSKGVESVGFDRDKDLVTATGRFNAEELAGVLADRMKRSVQVVPPKKSDKDDGKVGNVGAGGAGEKKDRKEGGPKVTVLVEDDEDEEDDSDDYDDEEGDGEEYGYGVGGGRFTEGTRAEYGGAWPSGYGGYTPPPLPPPQGHYGMMLYGQTLHAPQMFSDENPNACSVM